MLCVNCPHDWQSRIKSVREGDPSSGDLNGSDQVMLCGQWNRYRGGSSNWVGMLTGGDTGRGGKCFNQNAIAVMFWRPVAIDVINLLKMTKMYYSLEISCAKTLRTGWSELGGAHMGGGWMAGSPPPTLIIGPSLPLYGSGSKKRWRVGYWGC